MAQLTLNQTTLLGATTGTIACVLLPLQGRQLLLPTLSVVEVLEGVELEEQEDKPAWFVGKLPWREGVISVFCFEALNGQVVPRERHRVAILNGITRQADMPSYGLIVQGAPKPARVKIAQLEDLEAAPTGPVEYLQIRYAGELACIPDLDALEERVFAAA